jgi:hypothetical protein
MGQCAIGSYSTKANQESLPGAQTLAKWVECVECYCDLVVDNHHLDLTAMQTLCLFTMYTTTYCDRTKTRYWARRLVLCAVRAKLHLELSTLDATSAFEVEMRRRLWPTILEVDIQISLGHGDVLPWTASIEYNVNQPSNIDDVQIHPCQKSPIIGAPSEPQPDPSGSFLLRRTIQVWKITDTSSQRNRSLQTRSYAASKKARYHTQNLWVTEDA